MKYIFLFLSLWTLSAQAQTINTAPIEAYWKITESLKNGDSLSLKVWKDFLNIEANQIYIENLNFSDKYIETLRKNIQYVYMPKYDSLMNVRIKDIERDPASHWQLYKVYVYRKYEDLLKTYVKELQNPEYFNTMYDRAWQWLPEKLQKKDTTVTISLIGIENDAIAGNGTIIATLWNIYNNDKLKKGNLCGHEMHHILRQGMGFENVSDNEKGIIYFLNSILNEGSADMIDKYYMLTHEKELPMELQMSDLVLYQPDSIIRQVDTVLMTMQNSKGKIFKTEKDYRHLIRWSSGHCPGYYMADIIARNGYKKQLLAHIQNPFYFIYLYNKAAKRDAQKPPLFSQSSIAYIKKLENKYWKGK